MMSLLKPLLRVYASLWVFLSRFASFYSVSMHLSRYSFRSGDLIREHFYRKMLRSVGENVYFPYGVVFSHSDICIGNNVRFGPYCTVGLFDFGNDIVIAQNVDFLSGNQQHGIENNGIPMSKQPGINVRHSVGSDVWIGAKCVIMNDVSHGCIVGSGAVVTRATEEFSINVGVPSKMVSSR